MSMPNELTVLAFMQLDGSASYQFISDSQDVAPINEMLNTAEFDSYFVLIDDGEYKEVYGMHGIIPEYFKMLTHVISNGKKLI